MMVMAPQPPGLCHAGDCHVAWWPLDLIWPSAKAAGHTEAREEIESRGWEGGGGGGTAETPTTAA